MRREMMRATHDEALALLRRAPYVHLASTTPAGEPVLRAVHGVLCGDALYFHGSPVGEKVSLAERPCVLSYEELLADIPSYWTDPEMACPATSLFVSVQVHGTLRRVHEGPEKSRALQALMERFQPEGGHDPIRYDDPRYRKQVDGVALWKLSLEDRGAATDEADGAREVSRVDAKFKLAQNRSPDYVRTVVERLWARGADGDVRAIELLLRANEDRVPRPARFVGPHGCTLHPWSDDAALESALPLLRDEYWNARRFDDSALRRAHHASAAWVIARDERGTIVATARAVSDTVKFAYIADVAVHRDWRGRGLGSALMAFLMDHPAVRRASRVELATRDAMAFYERMGFSVISQQQTAAHVRSGMALLR